jgi:hypothetical protein
LLSSPEIVFITFLAHNQQKSPSGYFAVVSFNFVNLASKLLFLFEELKFQKQKHGTTRTATDRDVDLHWFVDHLGDLPG